MFYEIWDAPLYTVGGKHLITQAIEACGGENVFAALTLPAPAVDVEAVLAARPEAIIAGTDRAARPAWLDGWRRWKELPAVANDRLYVVDADLLHRPGPRFPDGVDALVRGHRRRAALTAGRASSRRAKPGPPLAECENSAIGGAHSSVSHRCPMAAMIESFPGRRGRSIERRSR